MTKMEWFERIRMDTNRHFVSMSIGFNDGPRRKWKSKLNNLNANEFIEIKSNDGRGDEQDDAAIYVVMWVPRLYASLLGHELNFTTTI